MSQEKQPWGQMFLTSTLSHFHSHTLALDQILKNLAKYYDHLKSKSFSFNITCYFLRPPFLSYVQDHSTGQSWDYAEASKAQDPEKETLNFVT